MDRKPANILILAGSTLAFGLALGYRGEINPWWTHALVGLFAAAAAATSLGTRLRALLAPRARVVALGIAVGAAMVAATHACFRIIIQWLPELEHIVAAYYRDIAADPPGPVVAAILIALVATAEELVWRGVTLDLFARRPVHLAGVASVLLYGLPHVIATSWLLLGVALAAGTVFTTLRIATRGLTAPVIAHVLWSASVFALFPLVSARA